MLNSKFTGEAMIFRNDKGFYSTTLSKKTQEGDYQNAYINVSFRKGVDIPNKTKINIKDAWLTFDRYEKDGTHRDFLKIFVNDFEELNKMENVENNINDDDLPF